MIYDIDFTENAKNDISYLKRTDTTAYKKVQKLLLELHEHPETGTGHPKPLGNNRAGQWSRRITEKHRLVYQIKESEVTVLVLSSYGHYSDK